MVVTGGEGWEGSKESKRSNTWWLKRTWTWVVNTHAVYRWHIVELLTINLYNFIKQCHPNKFNLKIKKNKERNDRWNPRLSCLPHWAQPRGEEQGSVLWREQEKTVLLRLLGTCRTISNYLTHTPCRQQGPAWGQLHFAPCHNYFMSFPVEISAYLQTQCVIMVTTGTSGPASVILLHTSFLRKGSALQWQRNSPWQRQWGSFKRSLPKGPISTWHSPTPASPPPKICLHQVPIIPWAASL